MQTIKNIWKAALFLFLTVTCLSFKDAFHPFYLSSTDIEISGKEKTIKVSSKVFTDDLQQAILLQQHKSVDLHKVDAMNKEIVGNYIKSHFSIQIGKQKVVLNSIGYEIEEEAVWCYLEAPLKDSGKNISFRNEILCESLGGQTNLIHCTYNGNRKSSKLICPEKECSFVFP